MTPNGTDPMDSGEIAASNAKLFSALLKTLHEKT